MCHKSFSFRHGNEWEWEDTLIDPHFGGVWGMSLPEETPGPDRGHSGEIMAFGWPETADKQLEDEHDYKPRGHMTRRIRTTNTRWQKTACATHCITPYCYEHVLGNGMVLFNLIICPKQGAIYGSMQFGCGFSTPLLWIHLCLFT